MHGAIERISPAEGDVHERKQCDRQRDTEGQFGAVGQVSAQFQQADEERSGQGAGLVAQAAARQPEEDFLEGDLGRIAEIGLQVVG